MNDPTVDAFVITLSIALFIGTLVGVPWVISSVPADRYSRPTLSRKAAEPTPVQWLMAAGRNLVGAVLFVLGVAMLVLPGQGLLAMFAGLLLLDFPGKRRLERRIIANPRVFRAVNALRTRLGRAPLEPPKP